MEYVSKKYPRTFHVPQSMGKTSDDKVLKSLVQFEGLNVVVTEKMDGENTTIHSKGVHARSVDGKNHQSRSWMKQFAANVSPYLSDNERICGEYMYARHSLAYDSLDTYFYGFAWFVDDYLQSWDNTVVRFSELGIVTVPLLYRGPYYAGLIDKLKTEIDFTKQEGFVMRNSEKFHVDDFGKYVGKYVRAGHVQTNKHWMHSEIIPNKLK